jgi:hypothetical protein
MPDLDGYRAIVRSFENFPQPATLGTALLKKVRVNHDIVCFIRRDLPSLKPGKFPRPEGRSTAGSLPRVSAGWNYPNDRNGRHDESAL